MTELQVKFDKTYLISLVKIPTYNESLTKAHIQLTISVSLLMAVAAEAHLAEGN